MSEFVPFDPRAPGLALRVTAAATIAAAAAIALVLGGQARDYRAEAIQLRDIAALAAKPATAAPDAALFHAAPTPQLAQADLQTSLQAIAQGSGVEIDVVRTEEVTRVDGLVRLGLAVGGTIPERTLGAFLAELDAARPVILVEDMTLRRTRTARDETERRVAFQFKLQGLSR